MPGGGPTSLLSDQDVHLFNEGTHRRLAEHLGGRLLGDGDRRSAHFAVWAPNAAAVSVIGDFNGWDPRRHPLVPAAPRASGRAPSTAPSRARCTSSP